MENVEISVDSPVVVEDAVCFETGGSRAQAADPALWVYEHHGQGFGWSDPGALTIFYDDLIHGRPMPSKFASKMLRDIDVLLAIVLHKKPDLVTCPNALKLVTGVDLVHRRGAVGMAHVDAELSQFFRFLRKLFPKDQTKRNFEAALVQAMNFIEDYILNDRLPQMGAPSEAPVVLDRGTGGFVVAETAGSLGEAWVHLFRNGFVRGVIFGKDQAGRRQVLGARKGPFVAFKIDLAVQLLNEMERAVGELPEWRNDALWLYGPPDGTTMVVSHILTILVRV